MKKLLKFLIIVLLIGIVIYFFCKEGIIDVEKLKEKCGCCGRLFGGKGSDDSIFEEE